MMVKISCRSASIRVTGAANAGLRNSLSAATAPINRAAAADRPLIVNLRCRNSSLGQIGVVGQHPGRRGQYRERLSDLFSGFLDEIGAARQSSDFRAQSVGFGGGLVPYRKRPVEPRRRHRLAHERRHHRGQRQHRAGHRRRLDQAAGAAVSGVANAVERQPTAGIRSVADLRPHRRYADRAQHAQQRRQIRPRDQQQAQRQPPVLPVGADDPVVPVKFLGGERGLPIHLEGERLIDLAFRGERQNHRLAQDIGLAQAQHHGFASRARQFGETGGAQRKLAEKSLLAVSAQADGNRFDPMAGGADRRDHRRIGGGRSGAAQALRQKIRQLSEPPAKEVTHHARHRADPDPRKSRSVMLQSRRVA